MKLGLGTAQFGMNYGVANSSGRISIVSAANILEGARELGIEFLDTAISYGNSEAVLGEIGVKSWKIITKLPPVPDGCSDVQKWIEENVLASIDRLGVKSLHALLLHRPNQLQSAIGTQIYQALQSVKAKGLVKKVGISVYGTQELEELLATFSFDLVQAPLNILDRSLVDTGWASRLKSAGIEIHTRSAFLQGLLLIPPCERPPKFDQWSHIWKEWDKWLATSNLSPLQACILYATSVKQVDVVMVGVDTVGQLNEIVHAVRGQLDNLPAFDFLDDSRLVNPSTWDQL